MVEVTEWILGFDYGLFKDILISLDMEQLGGDLYFI